MKGFQYLAFVVAILFFACDDTAPDACKDLKHDLEIRNLSGVQSVLNPWLSVLAPQVSAEDHFEHEQNLQFFVDRLNEECRLQASIVCYACIQTLPAQSEIKIILDSMGHDVIRILDLRTPYDDVMTVIRIHE